MKRRQLMRLQKIARSTLAVVLLLGGLLVTAPQQTAYAGVLELGDYVWYDADGDGQQDPTESGINGVLIKLYRSNGDADFEPGDGTNGTDTFVGDQTTANNSGGTPSNGYYIYRNLVEDAYWVVVDSSNFNPGGPLEGMLLTSVSPSLDANPSLYSIALGLDNLKADFGFARPGIELTKVANSAPDGTTLNLPAGGGEVTFTYTFTNTGDITLQNFELTDDMGTPTNTGDDINVASCSSLFLSLAPGQSHTCQYGPVTITRDYTNTATIKAFPYNANGDLLSNTPITDSDEAVIDVANATGAIGDRVWLDTNGNGIQDDGNTGISGVTVNLLNEAGTATLETTATDGNGNYSFTGLQAGNYIVEFVLPGGYAYAPANRGSNEAADSDAANNGRTDVISLSAGETDNTIDAGLYQPAALGDRVWVDSNANGIQNSGEPGLSGVTVQLLDGNGNATGQSTQTDGNGNYSFSGLAPGSYQVQFVAPGGFAFTTQNVNNNSNDTADSDANPGNGRTGTVLLSSGQTNSTVDAGLYQPTALGDRVWVDTNANGIQEGNETTGVANVTVTLTGVDGGGSTVNQTTQTNGSGNYSFTGLTPGSYQVSFSAPTGYVFSPQNQGGDDSVDSDANSSGQTPNVTLTSGETNDTIDAGLYQSATLGDFVWDDANQNGIQDAGEDGINGVTVNLLDGNGNPTGQSTTTAGGGFYSFTGLTPGSYIIEFIAPNGLSFTAQNANNNSNDAVDSDTDPNNGRTDVVTLASGETNDTIDAGLFAQTPVLASLGDRVWEDQNGNGIQDAGEPGIDGVTVNLLDGNGNPTGQSTTTAGGGFYSFTDLNPDSYTVEFVTPNGYIFTFADQGSNDAVDSDADPGNGRTDVITLTSGENDVTVDAGLYQPAALGDRVWQDTNANGTQDDGEQGLPDVAVTLAGIDGSGNSVNSSTTTDASGNYNFSNLAPGSYQVSFSAPSGYVISPQNQGDDSVDSDANSSGQTPNVTLTSGETNDTVDAGLYQPAALGDRVWQDTNANGTQDDGEPGLPGVTIQLLQNGVVVASATSDADGDYLFVDLAPGSYQVSFSAPSGYVFSPADQDNDAIDSDADSSGQTPSVTLTSGETNDTVDAGLYQPAALGDFVWDDLDANGIQDAGEPGIEGVTVTLLDGNGNPTGQSTTTDASGSYNFSNLAPGSYQVSFTAPSGYVFSPQNQGDDSVDSDADSSGRTETVTLLSGETDDTVDAGLYHSAALGDRVWQDTDRNGIQDAGERGFGNVTVQLFQEGIATPIATTLTDNNGNYLFERLVPDNYQVQFLAPGDFVFSPQNQGDDENVDSDADSSGRTETVTLTSGEVNRSVDAGLHEPFVPAPDYTIEKVLVPSTISSDGIIVVGDTVSYQINVVNTGNTVLETIPLEDAFDVDFLGFVSASLVPDGVTNGTLSWNDVTSLTNGALGVGQSLSVLVTFVAKQSTVNEPNQQTINTATVRNAQDETGTTLPTKSDTEPIRITNPGIGISKVTSSPADGIVELNEEVVFTIRVENTGDTTLVEIPVYDIYEANILEFVGTNVSAPVNNTDGADGELFWADITEDFGGSLTPGAAIEFNVTFRLISEQDTTNVAETGEATDANGDKVAPVVGASDASVRPAEQISYGLWLPGLSAQEAEPTPTPTPTTTPPPPIGSGEEEECPPGGCPVAGLVHPKGIEMHDALQMLFIVSRDNNTLIKYDPTVNEIVATAETGDEPWDVVVNEQTNQVYVTNFASGDLWVYDAVTMQVLKKIDIGPNPAMAEVLPAINTVAVVVRGINGIAIVENDALRQYLPTYGAGAFGIASDPVNNRIFVSNRDAGNGYSYYRENGAWKAGVEFKFGERGQRLVPFDLAYSPNNQRLYALYHISSGQWYVDVFHVKAHTVIARERATAVESSGSSRDGNVGGVGLEVNPLNGHVYTANTFAGSISVLAGDGQLLSTVEIGPDPYDVAVNPTTETVYVTLRAVNRLAKFDDFN